MTWRTHLLGGVGSLWLLRPLESAGNDLSNLGLLAAFAGLGALLPDLDAQAGCSLRKHQMEKPSFASTRLGTGAGIGVGRGSG